MIRRHILNHLDRQVIMSISRVREVQSSNPGPVKSYTLLIRYTLQRNVSSIIHCCHSLAFSSKVSTADSVKKQ